MNNNDNNIEEKKTTQFNMPAIIVLSFLEFLTKINVSTVSFNDAFPKYFFYDFGISYMIF